MRNTGPNHANEPVFLVVGHLQKPHGVRGEIEMGVITSYPERLQPGKKVFLGEQHIPKIIVSKRWKNDVMLLSFEGEDTREQVRLLTNMDVFVREDQLPQLPAGEYYHHELIGLKVFEAGNFVGEVVQLLETGANDVYVIQKPDRKELLLPAIESVILNIDIKEGILDVKIPEGLG
jgi:16S rRNA processing protein RimM